MGKLIGILNGNGELGRYFFKKTEDIVHLYGNYPTVFDKHFLSFPKSSDIWNVDSFCLVEVNTIGKVNEYRGFDSCVNYYSAKDYIILNKISYVDLVKMYTKKYPNSFSRGSNLYLSHVVLKYEDFTSEDIEAWLLGKSNVFPKVSASDIFFILESPKVTKSIINILLDNYKDLLTVNMLERIFEKQEINSETLNKLIDIIFSFENFNEVRSMFVDNVITHPSITEELLDKIVNFILSINSNPKSETTYSAYGYPLYPMGPQNKDEEVIYHLMKNPKLSEISFIKILERLTGHKSFIELYKHIEETGDLDLFLRLLYIEKIEFEKICSKETNCDNELDFKKGYLRILKKYLNSDNLEIRFKVLEEMIKEGYLTNKDIEIINSEYIKKLSC